MQNLYFDLTRELNESGPIAALASGQAVVFYRLAMMSKDGDWVLLETAEACARALAVLGRHGARYRAGAPLDIRWLAGGWSSHFEFFDSKRRRIRCDFVTRPPRVRAEELAALFSPAPSGPEGGHLVVVPVETLVHLKRTQRAKDYPVIGELARLLPPERELELTTDPDRVLALAGSHGGSSTRPAVRAALAGRPREEIVTELAREADRLQMEDRRRLERYRAASEEFLHRFQSSGVSALPLPQAHPQLLEIADRWLPLDPISAGGPSHGTAE